MVWKFCGKAQFVCAFTQSFHTMKLGESLRSAISRALTAEISPLRISSNRAQTFGLRAQVTHH